MKQLRYKTLYVIMLAVAFGFIGYALYVNFVHDPAATGFLGHKTNLARPINLPVWLNVMGVHVAFACVAMAAGAINFSSRVWRKRGKLHRANGYLYLTAVLAVVITSGYMAPHATGGKAVSMAFNLLNLYWPFATIFAIVMIKKKRIERHRRWMARSYAFCFTNMAIHLITFFLNTGAGMAYTSSYTAGVYGAVLLLLVLPELVIRGVWSSRPADLN